MKRRLSLFALAVFSLLLLCSCSVGRGLEAAPEAVQTQEPSPEIQQGELPVQVAPAPEPPAPAECRALGEADGGPSAETVPEAEPEDEEIEEKPQQSSLPTEAEETEGVSGGAEAVQTSVPESPSDVEKAEQYISLTVTGYEDKLLLSEELVFTEGMSCLDALLSAAERAALSIEKSGSGSLAYIKKIGDEGEFDHGMMSGWVYKVNGELAAKGIGATLLSPGDRLSLYYTTDLGADVKDKP